MAYVLKIVSISLFRYRFYSKPDSLPHLHVCTDASTSYGAGDITTDIDLYLLHWSKLPKSYKLFNNTFKLPIDDQIIYLE